MTNNEVDSFVFGNTATNTIVYWNADRSKLVFTRVSQNTFINSQSQSGGLGSLSSSFDVYSTKFYLENDHLVISGFYLYSSYAKVYKLDNLHCTFHREQSPSNVQ